MLGRRGGKKAGHLGLWPVACSLLVQAWARILGPPVVSILVSGWGVIVATADACVLQACLRPAACLLGSSSTLEAEEMD